MISPERGLVKLLATGKTIQTNRYGTELKDSFTEIRDTIAKTYGPPQHAFDFLTSGSIWDEPRDWMMGVVKKERTLASYWDQAPLPNHITLIGVEAVALSMERGYLSLIYEFEGFTEYARSKKAKAGSVF
jgi:hypothetical protein